MIKSMLAHLDLAHGLVTEITPMYGQYEISAKQPGWTLQNEKRGDPVFGGFEDGYPALAIGI